MHVDVGTITYSAANAARSRGGHDVLGRQGRVHGLIVGGVALIRWIRIHDIERQRQRQRQC